MSIDENDIKTVFVCACCQIELAVDNPRGSYNQIAYSYCDNCKNKDNKSNV